MPRSTNHQVQRRLHGRPPVRFRRRASQFVVSSHSHVHHRASLRRRPAAALDPGRLGHAHAEPHPWLPPGQQEMLFTLQVAAARRGGQEEARPWRLKQQGGHGSWSCKTRTARRELRKRKHLETGEGIDGIWMFPVWQLRPTCFCFHSAWFFLS